MAENRTTIASCHTERTVGDATVVELRGEIDILTESALSVRIDALTAGTCPDLVLDLRPVTFIDCSGLRLLCRAHNRVQGRQGRLRLIADRDRLMRILQPARLAGVFEIHPDLPTALFGARRQDALAATAG
ncbi:STAS domain-containing protein [Streptomyces sp. NPDC047081]|uniref:STAS domain-containing protein n=1 Tax=Streptomyces sp. NPDC047081 TaxID=3154706 RepID=UPI00340551AC